MSGGSYGTYKVLGWGWNEKTQLFLASPEQWE